MKPIEAVDVLEHITMLFTWFDLKGPEQAALWAKLLGSVTREEALEAVERHARTSSKPPTIRDVRESVAGTRGLLAPSAEVALPQMRAWLFFIDQAGYVNGSGYSPAKPQVHPAVREGSARMGGNWEDGFRFEWPKVAKEYNDKILGGPA